MITHLQRKSILRTHVYPEIFADDKTAYGRELKIAAQITTNGRYGDIAFWENLGLGFKLRSLAWFKTPDGAATLEKSWRMYLMQKAAAERAAEEERAILQNMLDTTLNSEIVGEPVECDKYSVTRKKQTALSWADSQD